MATTFRPARLTVTLPAAKLAQPVLVDLLDGGVYALPDDGHTGQCRFENLPLADSPLVVCDRTMVELTP